MSIEKNIWYEMTELKTTSEYYNLTINRQSTRSLWHKIMVMAFGAFGIIAFKFLDPTYMLWSIILMVIFQLLSIIKNSFMLLESEIYKMIEVKKSFMQQFNELEKLWMQYKSSPDAPVVTKKFNSIKKKILELKSAEDGLDYMFSSRLHTKAGDLANIYLKNRYY